MTPSPTVSVAMAAYNAERFIAAALEGILAQSHPVLEVVVCDDGSSDGTPEILGQMADRDDRIRVLRNEPNQGGYAAMNRAMAETRGDFVALYHADDVYDGPIVARQAAFLQRHPRAGVVFCLDRFLDEAGREYARLTVPPDVAGRELFDGPTLTDAILRHKNVFLVTPTAMFRREAFEGAGGFDHDRFGIAADLDLWLRLSLQWDIGLIHEHLMGYRHFAEQWSRVYARARVDPEMYFPVMDHHLSRPGVRPAVDDEAMTCYRVHAARDNVERAANLLQLGDRHRATALLDRVWVRPLLDSPLRREVVRILGLRTLIRLAARAGGGPVWRRLVFAARFRRWPPKSFDAPPVDATHSLATDGARAARNSGSRRGRPRVAVFLDPFSYHFYGDGIFDAQSGLNRDGALKPWFHLREHLASLGVPLRTADYFDEEENRGETNAYVSFGVRKPLDELRGHDDLLVNAFYLFEVAAVDPDMYRAIPDLQEVFRTVYAWTDPESLAFLVPGELRLKPFRIPMPHEDVLEPYWSRTDRRGTVMVAGNKTAALSEGELYTERLRVLSHLAPHGGVHLWGRGWDRGLGDREAEFGEVVRGIYQGATADKFDTISRYATAICYENMVMRGWITEKIFDCFYAGTVPIYLGAPDITDYIPPETFIDRRDFTDDEALRRFLDDLTDEELAGYREAAREFFASEAFAPFTAGAFAERFVEDLSLHLRERGLPGIPQG